MKILLKNIFLPCYMAEVRSYQCWCFCEQRQILFKDFQIRPEREWVNRKCLPAEQIKLLNQQMDYSSSYKIVLRYLSKDRKKKNTDLWYVLCHQTNLWMCWLKDQHCWINVLSYLLLCHIIKEKILTVFPFLVLWFSVLCCLF